MKKLLTIISIMMMTSLGFSQGSQIDLPVTFDDPAVNYSLTDFGGNSSALVVDPTGGPNMVARSIKTINAMSWAGTTMGPASGTGFATPIPFTATQTKMNVRVYSPAMGIPIRLKVEDATDPTKSVETQVISTMANAWETLEFDFSNQAMGTAALNLAFTYDKASIFFYFGTDGMMAGADTTYYWDDVQFGAGGSGGLTQIDLPVTFDGANVDYSLTDFGGNSSALVVDPTGGPNMVARSIKTLGAMSWAGTTMGPASGTGFATPIPFTASNTKMKVRVYSPAVGIPIRLKVEDATNAGISAETEATSTMANAWETLEFDFSNPAMGTAALNLANTYDKASLFFYFGTAGNMAGADTTYFWDDVEFVGGGSGGLSQIDLPVTFDDTTVDYSLTDFGGNSSAVVVDPAGGPNMVARSIKTLNAMSWAGTTMGPASGTGFATPIPFTASNTKMTVRVYSPAVGIPIRLKVEDATNAGISVETEATSTMANAWETLEFDFNNPAMGTAALNLANTYDKASIFFYFGTDGMMAGADTTFHWDDVEFVGGGGGLAQIDLPVTFDDATVDYSLTDFGGNSSAVVVDPAGGPNMVARSIKTLNAMSWAGTTMGPASGTGFATPIPFTASNTKMTVRVYSPAAGIPIRLKVEDATDPTKSAETEATSTMANAWETLEFDFNNPAMGTAALNLANTYDKASIFFYFGTDGMMAGADTTFHWDDVEFVGGGGGLSQIDLPVTFDDATVDYSLTDFGGNSSAVVVDPAGGPNMVARSFKTLNAMSWAGTTMGPASGTGFVTPIPFTATETKMNVRVYSPAAGIPIRLKVEDATDPTRSVETEAMSTMANAWETLEFDFSNEAPGTAALNLAFTFDKASIFFYFGTDGMMAGADTTYYWDDVKFGAGGGSGLAQIDLPVTFDDATVDYSLTDFGGNSSAVVVDPAGGPNMVARSFKTLNAMSWAGTTMGPASGTGFATAIPFTATETKMNVRVYSPAAGIPIRLKVEDATDPTKSVETEAMSTMANAWEVLEFDFSNEAMGTAALDLANTYDKGSIFFYFGTDGMMAGADTTFYWDDVEFGASGPVLSQIDLPVTFDDPTVDYTVTDFGGNATMLVTDPTGGPNMVARTFKTLGAMGWAGTTMGPPSGTGFANPIPFTATETKMTVRVYSPAAGIPIRFKVEDATDGTKSVETEAMSTVANAWEVLEFDFSNEAMGTAALDLANTYDKGSLFFHFGTDGMMAGADTTFYWDDCEFGGKPNSIAGLQEIGVTYYPNPVNDVLKINAKRQIDEIQVYNLMGQQVMPSQAGRDQISVDMSTLSPGVYTVKVKAGETVGTFKIVKN